MFQTLETTWDRSGRRRWSTLASFTMQALALSLLLAVPLLWVQGPPRLRWIDASILTPPSAPTPPAPPNTHRATNVTGRNGGYVVQLPAISIGISQASHPDAPPAPGIRDIGGSVGPRVG